MLTAHGDIMCPCSRLVHLQSLRLWRRYTPICVTQQIRRNSTTVSPACPPKHTLTHLDARICVNLSLCSPLIHPALQQVMKTRRCRFLFLSRHFSPLVATPSRNVAGATEDFAALSWPTCAYCVPLIYGKLCEPFRRELYRRVCTHRSQNTNGPWGEWQPLCMKVCSSPSLTAAIIKK